MKEDFADGELEGTGEERPISYVYFQQSLTIWVIFHVLTYILLIFVFYSLGT